MASDGSKLTRAGNSHGGTVRSDLVGGLRDVVGCAAHDGLGDLDEVLARAGAVDGEAGADRNNDVLGAALAADDEVRLVPHLVAGRAASGGAVAKDVVEDMPRGSVAPVDGVAADADTGVAVFVPPDLVILTRDDLVGAKEGRGCNKCDEAGDHGGGAHRGRDIGATLSWGSWGNGTSLEGKTGCLGWRLESCLFVEKEKDGDLMTEGRPDIPEPRARCFLTESSLRQTRR